MKDRLDTLTRPHFFPGQLIDHKDFNRLAEQPEKVLSGVFRHLFDGGGILVKALAEFEVAPLSGFSVRVKPGVALLPNGQPLVLGDEQILDLTEYVPARDYVNLIVSLRSRLKGLDRYVDREDSTITGFRTEGAEPELVVSVVPLLEGVEIFRVRLEEGTTSLRMATSEEEWRGGLEGGVIDLRSRSRIVPQTFSPLSAGESLELRKALYGIERSHDKLRRIYLLDDPFPTVPYLTQLHAELLNRPLQPLKISFLVAEFAEKLSLFLDRLLRQAGNNRSNFDKATLLKAVELLERLKQREVLPRPLPLGTISELADCLTALVDYAERKFSLLNTVEEAFLDIRDRAFAFDDKVVLAGHLFERIDRLSADDETRYDIKGAPNAFPRMLSTRFRNGDVLSLKGRFVKDGALALRFQVRYADRPLVLLMHQYVRRAGTTLQYEINGKHLVTDQCEYSDLQNAWINRGLVVAAEMLVPQENLLTIRVQKSDLDHGFFDLAVYQPSVLREVAEIHGHKEER
jgi:hypothetical protein